MKCYIYTILLNKIVIIDIVLIYMFHKIVNMH